ncbi:MAG TPA: alpha/beta hydrolase [Rhodocyclaceae bacterium]|nr:alpha/beta hydrolase [Rhodocyclaceae bacterium]
MLPSRSEFLPVRGLRLHVRRWGDPAAPTLFLLHGWMDVSASFQFTVDALARDWNIVAPDWRGFGPSEWLGRPYIFAEHLGDLEAILDHYAPGAPVRLVGHSMGGILACLYAGIRPERVRKVVTLEGFGIAPNPPAMAPERYRKWLDCLQSPPRMHVYTDRAAFARRLQHDDRFLTPERAAFLSKHLAREAEGGVVWNGDPWHKAPGPYLFRLEESMAVWRQATAPVLWVVGRDSWVVREFATRPGDWEARRACFAQVEEHWIDDAGHMLHHDQPEAVARLAEEFLLRT